MNFEFFSQNVQQKSENHKEFFTLQVRHNALLMSIDEIVVAENTCARFCHALPSTVVNINLLEEQMMSLTIRKIIVLGLIGLVLLIGNVLFVANCLAVKGVVDWAKNIRTEYLTGTAITIIAVLLILLVSPRIKTGSLIQRCPVCDHRLIGSPNYCGDCGSKVS